MGFLFPGVTWDSHFTCFYFSSPPPFSSSSCLNPSY
uniref:Uncharacterized protein n=1 Tax=Populus tremula x Populus tremuloides TaxID=47664 RepID=O49933_POPPZ|nr:hypothetical protein [Populus tremula x Populus tremuloides]